MLYLISRVPSVCLNNEAAISVFYLLPLFMLDIKLNIIKYAANHGGLHAKKEHVVFDSAVFYSWKQTPLLKQQTACISRWHE